MAGHGGHTRGHLWTDDDTATMIALHGEGKSLHHIAEVIGCTKRTVSKYAEIEGLDWDRSRTEAATVARTVDARARRQAAADRIWALFDDAATYAETARTGKFQTLVKGQYGKEVVKELPFIPTDHGRQLAASLTQFVNAATKIEAIDADSGVADAVSMLGKLAHAIGLVDDVDDTTDDDGA